MAKRSQLLVSQLKTAPAALRLEAGDHPPDHFRLEDSQSGTSLDYLLRRILASMTQQADGLLKSHNLTFAQCGLFLRLMCAGRSTTAEVARLIQLVMSQIPEILCKVMNDHLGGFSDTEYGVLKLYLMRMAKNADAVRASDFASHSPPQQQAGSREQLHKNCGFKEESIVSGTADAEA